MIGASLNSPLFDCSFLDGQIQFSYSMKRHLIRLLYVALLWTGVHRSICSKRIKEIYFHSITHHHTRQSQSKGLCTCIHRVLLWLAIPAIIAISLRVSYQITRNMNMFTRYPMLTTCYMFYLTRFMIDIARKV